eukprot:TRINITY_DN5576_c0_g1_i2.p1 TRINITY_DN5576_c0_g1~~TRINITY_DN5576_c0_g1_i2.p1  ORF type:complete len:368 (-),score=50.71 TRINITY_DN5576_c0_g1_i2:1506-2579(-)
MKEIETLTRSNNRYQDRIRELEKKERERDDSNKKLRALEEFIGEVGAVLVSSGDTFSSLSKEVNQLDMDVESVSDRVIFRSINSSDLSDKKKVISKKIGNMNAQLYSLKLKYESFCQVVSESHMDYNYRILNSKLSGLQTKLDGLQVKDKLECSICLDLFDQLEELPCGHRFCKEDIVLHIKHEYNSDTITCPSNGCKQVIQDVYLEYFLFNDQELLKKIQERQIIRALGTDNKKFCPLCNFIYVFDESAGALTRCLNCDRMICSRCSVPWQKGHLCDIYQQDSNNNSKTSLESLGSSQGWKKCANCGHMIVKNGGCNHIVCTCKYSFCYTCGEAVLDTTKHYSARHPMFTEKDLLS